MAESPSTDHAGLEILTPAECEDLIAATPIGRVGFAADGEQHILPVNYVWRHGAIAFRTAPGHKLTAAIDYGEVAFEVDRWDENDESGWSVLVRGALHVVVDEDELLDLEHVPMSPWARNADKPFWVRIIPEEITGRRVPA